jgi:hypothetical protein
VLLRKLRIRESRKVPSWLCKVCLRLDGVSTLAPYSPLGGFGGLRGYRSNSVDSSFLGLREDNRTMANADKDELSKEATRFVTLAERAGPLRIVMYGGLAGNLAVFAYPYLGGWTILINTGISLIAAYIYFREQAEIGRLSKSHMDKMMKGTDHALQDASEH